VEWKLYRPDKDENARACSPACLCPKKSWSSLTIATFHTHAFPVVFPNMIVLSWKKWSTINGTAFLGASSIRSEQGGVNDNTARCDLSRKGVTTAITSTPPPSQTWFQDIAPPARKRGFLPINTGAIKSRASRP